MCCVAGNDISISKINTAISVQVRIIRKFVFFFFFNGILFKTLMYYIVSKLFMNIPAPAIIISGGAIIDNIGGNAPVAPSALNKLIKKYNAKHVIMPRLNLIPKL